MRRGSREERGAGGVLTRTPLGPGLPCGPADPCNKEKIVVPFVTMTAHWGNADPRPGVKQACCQSGHVRIYSCILHFLI